MNLKRCFFIVVFCLGGCGFHLRGSEWNQQILAPVDWHIPSAYYGWQKALRDTLRQYGLTLTHPSRPTVSVQIIEERIDSEIISLSPTSPVKQTVLHYQLRARITKNHRSTEELIQINRSASSNDNQIYNTQGQISTLTETARLDGIHALIHRLSASSSPEGTHP